MTKILFVGVFSPNSTNVAQVRAFGTNGHDAYAYDYRAKVATCGSATKRDDDLIEQITKLKPNLTLFSKCNQMSSHVVDAANLVGTTVLWYMDGMNNFDKELIEKIKKVNFFISGIEGPTTAGLEYNTNSSFLPQCPDERMNFPFDEAGYKYDVTFIGSLAQSAHATLPTGRPEHADRQEYLKAIKFQHFNNAYGLQHNLIVNQSKINLNFSHTSTNGTSVRLYKILAAKSFLLTTPWEGMNELFTPGEDFDTFESPEELKTKIAYYLNDEKARDKIRTHGHQTVQQYMPEQWARNILGHVGKLDSE